MGNHIRQYSGVERRGMTAGKDRHSLIISSFKIAVLHGHCACSEPPELRPSKNGNLGTLVEVMAVNFFLGRLEG
jgi:hypothetical protein